MALGRGAYEGSAGPFRYRIEATGQGRFAARVIRRGRTIAQASQFSTVVGAKGWCQHQHVMRSIGR